MTSEDARPVEVANDFRVDRHGDVLTLTFTRPDVHNALSSAMYEGLARTCARVRADGTVRCLVVRGSPGGAFAAGTDINYLRNIRTGDDGVAYERYIQTVVSGVLELAVPTVAVVEGYALGGGLLLASACDLRLCTPSARFGMPIARTLGNCISQFGFDLLARSLGRARVLEMLLTAELFDASAGRVGEFVMDVVEQNELEQRLARLLVLIVRNAPLTLSAAKQADRAHRADYSKADEFVRTCYGSADFAMGVSAFLEGREPVWAGK